MKTKNEDAVLNSAASAIAKQADALAAAGRALEATKARRLARVCEIAAAGPPAPVPRKRHPAPPAMDYQQFMLALQMDEIPPAKAVLDNGALAIDFRFDVHTRRPTQRFYLRDVPNPKRGQLLTMLRKLNAVTQSSAALGALRTRLARTLGEEPATYEQAVEFLEACGLDHNTAVVGVETLLVSAAGTVVEKDGIIAATQKFARRLEDERPTTKPRRRILRMLADIVKPDPDAKAKKFAAWRARIGAAEEAARIAREQHDARLASIAASAAAIAVRPSTPETATP